MSFSLSSTLGDVGNTIVNWVPTLITVLAIIIIGWIIAVALRSATRKLLDLARLNDYLERTSFGEKINSALNGASTFAGRVVYVVVWLGTLSVAASRLKLEPVNDVVAAVYSYIPNILAALAIFVIAVMVTGFTKRVTSNVLGETPTGRIVSTVVPVVVMSIAGFMILNQLSLAPEIVNITYGALMGALALGLALAFGLGGRDVAARMLEQAYKSGQKTVEQAKKDTKVKKAPKKRS